MRLLSRSKPRKARDLSTGGKQAREQMETALAGTRERREEVQQLAAELRIRRRLNGFTNDIEIAIGRRP